MAPLELEFFSVATGAVLYTVYMGISRFQRWQASKPDPSSKLAVDVATAAAASLADDASTEPCAEPCAEPDAEDDLAEPAVEPEGCGSPCSQSPSGSSSASLPPRRAQRLPPGALEARLAELERAVVRAAEAKRQQKQQSEDFGGKLSHWLLLVALALWCSMTLAQQFTTSESYVAEDALLAAVEPSASYLMEASGPLDMGLPDLTKPAFSELEDALLADMAEPALAELEGAGALAATEVVAAADGSPSTEELAAAGYSVDSNGHITLSLSRQQTTIREQGEITYHKSAYWGTIYVGTPPRPYKVVFDTGSGHLVLPSTYCFSETCRAHQRYKRSASKSAKDIDADGTEVSADDPRDQITVNFGTGEITGVFVEDTVCLNTSNSSRSAPSAPTPPTATGDSPGSGCMTMRMIAATAMSDDPFKTFEFDGILGLGLDGLSQTPEFNFIHSVASALGASQISTSHTFAVFLGDHKAEESELTIGGWSQKHMIDDELVWRPVLDPELGHWMVEVSAVYVDDERVSFCDEGAKCKAVVDTGTSLLAVPTPSFPELFELLRHRISDDYTCDGHGPRLHFELGGAYNVTVGSQEYSRVQEVRRQSPLRHREEFGAVDPQEFVPQNVAYCKPLLMSMELPAPIGPKLFILGEPILRKYYTVYDAEAKRVGFGRARHDTPLPPSGQDDAWFWEEDDEESE